MTRFAPATREQIKLRLGLDGPSGSGKTFTALHFAKALGEKIAVIDSEHGSASKYVGDDGIMFDVHNLQVFSPSEYTMAINDAARAGYDVIVVDSLSHAWMGKGGVLEIVDNSSSKNKFGAWREASPMHRDMIEAILAVPCHIICTLRSKTEYVLNDENKPIRVGTAPEQRSGMEFEFDVYCSMNHSHIMTVSKSRCSIIDQAVIAKPNGSFMEPVLEWLRDGTTARKFVKLGDPIGDQQIELIIGMMSEAHMTMKVMTAWLLTNCKVMELEHLQADQVPDVIKHLNQQILLTDARKKVAAQAAAAATPEATPPEAKPPAQFNDAPEPGQVTQDQMEALSSLVEQAGKVGLPAAAWNAALAKCGCTSVASLTLEDADKLINWLKTSLTKLQPDDGSIPKN